MEIEPIKINSPPVLDLVNWVAKNPDRATQVGAGLVVIGGLILLLDALFRS